MVVTVILDFFEHQSVIENNRYTYMGYIWAKCNKFYFKFEVLILKK